MKSKILILFSIIRTTASPLRWFIIRWELLLFVVVELLLWLLLVNTPSLPRSLASHAILWPEALREVALTDCEVIAVHELSTLIKLVNLLSHQFLNSALLFLRSTGGLVGKDWQGTLALWDVKVYRLLGLCYIQVEVLGHQVSLGLDYLSLCLETGSWLRFFVRSAAKDLRPADFSTG